MLGQHPLNFEGLPSLIEGHHGMSPLGWNATFVENHTDAIFTPLGVIVNHVPLEGLGQEVCSSLVGGRLLHLWGDVDVNYLLPNVKCNIQNTWSPVESNIQKIPSPAVKCDIQKISGHESRAMSSVT
jgi:hypothetical protein